MWDPRESDQWATKNRGEGYHSCKQQCRVRVRLHGKPNSDGQVSSGNIYVTLPNSFIYSESRYFNTKLILF